MRVLSIRNQKTQYGQKLLAEVEEGFVYLPGRYTDLFIKSETDNFYAKTPQLSMTITDLIEQVSTENETYITPALEFSVELKRTYAAAKTGNSSLEALASTSKAFEAAKASLKAPSARQKKKPPQESQAWGEDDEAW